jgi:hypothetical protein
VTVAGEYVCMCRLFRFFTFEMFFHLGGSTPRSREPFFSRIVCLKKIKNVKVVLLQWLVGFYKEWTRNFNSIAFRKTHLFGCSTGVWNNKLHARRKEIQIWKWCYKGVRSHSEFHLTAVDQHRGEWGHIQSVIFFRLVVIISSILVLLFWWDYVTATLYVPGFIYLRFLSRVTLGVGRSIGVQKMVVVWTVWSTSNAPNQSHNKCF